MITKDNIVIYVHCTDGMTYVYDNKNYELRVLDGDLQVTKRNGLYSSVVFPKTSIYRYEVNEEDG